MQIKAKVFVGLFLALFSVSSVSYAHPPKLWFDNDGGWSRDYLTDGKKKVTQGLFGKFDLEELVADNPNALLLLEKHSEFDTYAKLSYWFGVIPSAFAYGWGIGSTDNPLTLVSGVALLGTALLTGHFVSESRHYLYEAVNLYNGVQKPAHESTQTSEMIGSPFRPSMASNSSVIGVSFNF